MRYAVLSNRPRSSDAAEFFGAPPRFFLSIAVRSDTRGELRVALGLHALEIAVARGQRSDGARQHLIDEELHVGAPERHAVRHARDAELRRLQIETLSDNAAMLRSAERNGFVREGVLRSSAWVMGEFLDEVLLGLLVQDWKPGPKG